MDHILRLQHIGGTVRWLHAVQQAAVLLERLHRERVQRLPADHLVAVACPQDLAKAVPLEELALEQELDG